MIKHLIKTSLLVAGLIHPAHGAPEPTIKWDLGFETRDVKTVESNKNIKEQDLMAGVTYNFS